MSICKAILFQGERKGQQCQKNKTENEYCVYHQRNHEYEQLIKDNKILCGMFFRGCNKELSEDDKKNKFKNCLDCRNKKSGKKFKCQFKDCNYKITKDEQKYCKKHIRQLLRDNASDHNIKYCDIERGCFNIITSDIKCEECKIKERNEVSHDITILRQKYDIQIKDSNDSNELYLKQEEKIINISEMWRSTQRNAYSRGLLFTITENEFEKIIIQPCYYCNFYSKFRLNGIDRIDNNKGYTINNSITSCKMCNIIKNTQHPIEFLEKVDAIISYIKHNKSNMDTLITKTNSYLSKKDRLIYKEYKYNCKKRNIDVLLTELEYNKLQDGICYLCGLNNSKNHKNGIDRIDSSIRVYSLENSRTCCGHCNFMKGVFSYNDFIEKCNQIKEHNCNKQIFDSISMYNKSICRNEHYTANEIFNMIIGGRYSQYIEWCHEKEKSPDFISAMNIISENDLKDKDTVIKNIQIELEKERHSHTQINKINDKKMFHCSTLHSYLIQGKVDYYVDWYLMNYKKSSLFDKKLYDLINLLPTVNKEDGIELCRKFMYDEKNLRNLQERRECDKKYVKYSNKTVNEEKKEPIEEKKNEIIHPKLELPETNIESIERKVKKIQSVIGYEKKTKLKQWKVVQIQKAILENKENQYREFCEQNNGEIPDWDIKWATFVLSVKSTKESEKIIRDFIEDLRRIRHNELCYNKNAKIVDREDREQWPSTTVLRAYEDGKINQFKEFQEKYTGDKPEDVFWKKKWAKFMEDLKGDNKIDIIKKFMTAQRTRVYRAKKRAS